MESKKPRIGIYGSLKEQSEVFQILAHILGYDPYAVEEIPADAVIAPVCGRAKTFGPHFTIYDIFTPTDYAALIERLKGIVGGYQPFDYTFTGFSGYVRGDYQGKSVYNDSLKTVLALDFDTVSREKFWRLHFDIVRNIQDLRARIEPEFDKEIFRNVPELWDLVARYGAPYVLENYSPHLTVASGLSGDPGQYDRLVSYLEKNYGKTILGGPIVFDAIYIFEEIIGGRFDGYFRIKDVIRFGRSG